MSIPRRVSVNTSLSNARIFDEDSSEDKDLRSRASDASVNINAKIKLEPQDHEFEDENAQFEFDTKPSCDMNFASSIDFGIRQNEFKQQLDISIKEELDDTTNDSIESNSRKSMRRTVFKRENPYDRPGVNVKQEVVDQKEAGKRRPVYETDSEILARRQKQIDYGKNTKCYDNYISLVKKNERKPTDPMTPNKYKKYSRRAFDGLIRKWRLQLHQYDS